MIKGSFLRLRSDQAVDIVGRYKNGETLVSLAKSFQVGRRTLRRFLHAQGISEDSPHPIRKPEKDTISAQIVQGSVWGLWTVKEVTRTRERVGRTRVIAVCICKCGTIRSMHPLELLRPRHPSRSCGCVNRKHGLWHKDTPGHAVYRCWANMCQRCLNTNGPKYKDWGGRGIKICPRWLEAKNFVTDMLPTWSPGMSLERIKNNRDYTKSNCRWVPRAHQPKNRRDNVMVQTPYGEMILAEAVRCYGKTCWRTVKDRITRGWPVWEAITAEADQHRQKYKNRPTKARLRG